MRYGLSNEAIEKILAIFSNYSEIDQATLYGSRAMNTVP